MCHIAVAMIIMGAVWALTGNGLAGALAGSFFYVGREFTQWEELKRWDWPGLLAPVAAVSIAYLVARLVV
ncbi:MAG TPA: hypothetical protein VH933_11705 [Aestuariivirgaceae bacterium]|jgi:hypothetical protein